MGRRWAADRKGTGEKARAGLVRALMAHKGYAADARHWAGEVSKAYRMMLLEKGEEKRREVVEKGGKRGVRVIRKGMKREDAEAERARLGASGDVGLGKMLRCRVRYFTDGAVIGSRKFVDDVFEKCRRRFGEKRTSGARRLRGSAAAAAGVLWSARDLKKGIGGAAT
jgi:putative transposase